LGLWVLGFWWWSILSVKNIEIIIKS